MRVVPSAAAHEVTAVCVRRGAVAQAPLGAHATRLGILLAVVGRALNVDQVGLYGLAEALGLLHFEEGGLSQPAGSDHLHVDRLVVLVLQDVADLAELGQRGPAGLGGARARHTVALTLQLHPLLQDLRGDSKVCSSHSCT